MREASRFRQGRDGLEKQADGCREGKDERDKKMEARKGRMRDAS
jgi:hypothetical protein